MFTPRPTHSRKRRRGAIVLWLLLALVAIIGTVAIGMDGGRMLEERRHAQAAADAAALAAAANLYSNYWTNFGQDPDGTAQAAALSSAAGNGYSNNGSNSIVTVHIPPQSGSFAGQAGYVEVIVESKLQAGFSSIFTQQGLPVQARAVAIGQPLKIGLRALRSSGADALRNSALALTVLNDPVIVNSNDPAAFDQVSFGVVAASTYRITGGYVNPGGAIISGSMHTYVPPSPDPLALLAVPSTAGVPVRSTGPLTVSGVVTTLQPGIYKGGITIQGASLLGITTPAVVLMMPGNYIIEGGGLTIGQNATVVGLETMIYNTSGTIPAGSISIAGGLLTTVTLTPPLSGTYQGILIFQDRNVTAPLTISGLTAVSVFTGVVYAASAQLNLTNSLSVGAFLLGGAYVASSMTIQGIGQINIDIQLNPPRIPNVHLVE